jgi:tetratricopeptide (TPR) repeat protein
MLEAYVERKDFEEAIFHGELANRYGTSPHGANNLGYLHLVSGNLVRARELLEVAVKSYQEPEDTALPKYNLGVVDAKRYDYYNAAENFKLAIELITSVEKAKRICACLVVPKLIDGNLEFQEVSDPDLLETATLAVVEELMHKGKLSC